MDPNRQPDSSSAPRHGASESPPDAACDAEGVALSITDAQGLAHRGSVVVRTSWAPDLGRLDESADEEFRIVVLAEPLPQATPSLDCGVAICAPNVAIRPASGVREAAVAYRAEPAEAVPQDGEPELALTPEHAAALSRGRLVASPALDLKVHHVFPLEEASPRLLLLAEALLAQRCAHPYLRVLAAALTAPASPPRCDRPGLLAALDGLLGDARGKSPDRQRQPALVAQTLDNLAQLARVATLVELAETARRLYPEPSELGEAVFLCRALVERPREAKELARLRVFLAEAVVPETKPELAMDRTLAQEQLSFAVLVAEEHRWPGMQAAFDRFRGRYRAAYLEHHRQYWRAALDLHSQLMDLAPKVYALRRLNTLTELGPPVGDKAIARYEELPARIGACRLALRPELDLCQEARCPACGIAMDQEPPWREVEDVQHRLEKALSQQLQRLSSKAVRPILSQSGEARVEEFLQVVQASQVQSLAHILDDELLGFLRRFLVEARVAEVLRPLVLRLQDPVPDLDPEIVDAAAELVRRTIHNAFSAAQQALPSDSTEEAQVQLPAGPPETE